MIPADREGEVSWGPATTTVTGISGQSDDTLARISLPFGIGGDGIPANYTADLIGGHGSTCPALLPNTSLRQMRSIVLTQWFDNGDGVMVCSTNGHRPDDAKANLVIVRLLLAESGHYILPISKDDQHLTDNEMDEVTRLWQKPYQATVLEQTCEKDEKLQFAKDFIEEPKIQDTKDVTVSEPEIQVMMNNSFDQEYDKSPQDYAGDVYPGHLAEGKIKYLHKMYRAVPEEFYSETRRVPVTPRNARSWMKKRRGHHYHFWEWCSGSGRLSLLALLAGLSVLFPIDYR